MQFVFVGFSAKLESWDQFVISTKVSFMSIALLVELKHKLNITGPMMDPCGMLNWDDWHEGLLSSIRTNCDRPDW